MVSELIFVNYLAIFFCAMVIVAWLGCVYWDLGENWKTLICPSYFIPISPLYSSIQNNMADGSPRLVAPELISISEQASSAVHDQQHEHSEKTKDNHRKAVNFEIAPEGCLMCELEHESPEFGPYCAVCHDFLYPNALLVCETETENTPLGASYEAVPSQSAECGRSDTTVCCGGILESEDSGCESENETKLTSEDSEPAVNPSSISGYKLPYLSLYERIRPQNYIAERLANELNFVDEDLFEKLPPESELVLWSTLFMGIILLSTTQ